MGRTDVRLRCAVPDDFQNAATEIADWSPVAEAVDVVLFGTHIDDADTLAAALADFDIVVARRDRVPCPRLKSLVASGRRNSAIDHAAAEAHGLTVRGIAGSLSPPPAELTWAPPPPRPSARRSPCRALLLRPARGIVEENAALRTGGPWQSTLGAALRTGGPRQSPSAPPCAPAAPGAALRGRCLGLLGLGKIGSRVAQVGLAFGMRVSAGARTSPRSAPSRSARSSSPPRRTCRRAASSTSSQCPSTTRCARPPPPGHATPGLRLPRQLRDELRPGGENIPACLAGSSVRLLSPARVSTCGVVDVADR